MEKHIETPCGERNRLNLKQKKRSLIDRWMKIKLDRSRCQYYCFLFSINSFIVVTGLLQQLPVNIASGCFAVIF